MELAIDTSTEIASIALSQEGEVVTELTWRAGQNHTLELLPNLVHLLDQAKADLHSIGGLIVARGPGSFNGLRVGVSTAKGLAFALKLPLVGISTLEIEAYPYAFAAMPICPIHNAGRGEIATALYQRQNEVWHQLVSEHLTTVDALCSQIRVKTIFCGEIPVTASSELKEKLGRRAVIPSPGTRLRRAGYLAELGWQRLQRGEYDDLTTFQPLYLRRPPITQPKSIIQVGGSENVVLGRTATSYQ